MCDFAGLRQGGYPLIAAHAQLALPRAALVSMSDEELAARDEELAAQLSELQAERDRRHRVMLLVGPSGDDDGQLKGGACSWFGCAPACDYAE